VAVDRTHKRGTPRRWAIADPLIVYLSSRTLPLNISSFHVICSCVGVTSSGHMLQLAHGRQFSGFSANPLYLADFNPV